MALIVCKTCKKAFLSGPKEETVCPICFARLRELYPAVRNFLRNNQREAYTALDVSRIMGIAVEDVESMVSAGFLSYQGGADGASAKVKSIK